MNSLYPGSLEYFGLLVAGSDLVDSSVNSREILLEEIVYQLDPEEIVYLLSSDRLLDFALVLNERVESIPSFAHSYINLCDRKHLLTMTKDLVERLREEDKKSYLIEALNREDLLDLLVLAAKKLSRLERQSCLELTSS